MLKIKIMKTTILTLLLSAYFAISISAQSAGSLKGKVLDFKTNEPIIGANVFLDVQGSIIGTTTDVDGRFSIKPLSPGSYEVNISYIGYNPEKRPASIYPGEPTFLKDIKLTQGIQIGGDGVVVYGGDKKEDEWVIDPGQIGKKALNPEDISNIAGSENIVMVIRATNSDIQVSSDGKDILFRGSRSGTSAYYVDGVKQNDMSFGIPSCAVGSIVVYSGGIPSQYGDVTGGVVVIESKSYFDVRTERRIIANKKKKMQMATINGIL